MNQRGLLTFLTLLVLWAVVSQTNHYLAVWHLHVFAGALYVTFAALRLKPRSGLIVAMLGGLLCDANTPVPFGTHTLLFTICHALIFKFRHRIPADQTASQVIIALIANAGLFFALSVVLAMGNFAMGTMLPRLLLDLLISQLFVGLISPWFFALQTRILDLDRYADRRRF